VAKRAGRSIVLKEGVKMGNSSEAIEVLKFANSPLMWALCIPVIVLVIIQALIFGRMAISYANKTKVLSKAEIGSALRTGAIASIGPAIGIFIICIGLISKIGGPITFMRVGVIGSASYELMAATFGAQAYGVELGGPGYNLQAFTNSVWTMALGGSGWLLVTALFTKQLDTMQRKVTASDPKLLGIIGVTASVGAFSALLANQVVGGWAPITTIVVAMLSMVLIQKLSERPGWRWIREWALGIAMVAGMAVTTIFFG